MTLFAAGFGWGEVAWQLGVALQTRRDLERVGGSDSWRIYPGRVPREWLLKVEQLRARVPAEAHGR